MKNYNPLQNPIKISDPLQDLLHKDQGGCCLCCAIRCNPGWVKENYPDYYYENIHELIMKGHVDPRLYPMNHMMDPMNQMKMMNPMINQINQMIKMGQMNNMMDPMNHMMDPMNQMNQMKMMNPMNNQMNQMIMTQMNKTNQIKNNSQDLNKDSNENILNQEINVLFNNNSESIPLNTIQCTLSDKVSDIIQKYINKTLDKETTNIFVYNGKALDFNMTAAEAGLNNQAIINVITTKNVGGA